MLQINQHDKSPNKYNFNINKHKKYLQNAHTSSSNDAAAAVWSKLTVQGRDSVVVLVHVLYGGSQYGEEIKKSKHTSI